MAARGASGPRETPMAAVYAAEQVRVNQRTRISRADVYRTVIYPAGTLSAHDRRAWSHPVHAAYGWLFKVAVAASGRRRHVGGDWKTRRGNFARAASA